MQRRVRLFVGLIGVLATLAVVATLAWPIVLLDVSTPRNRALVLLAIDRRVLSVHATFSDHGPNDVPLVIHSVAWADATFVGALLDRGANINATDSAGQTALNMAIEVGNLETVALLADRGANLNKGAAWGHGPLVQAVEKGDVECVRLLVDRGASVAGVSTRPVHAAIRKRDVAILQVLIEGARRELGDEEGLSAVKGTAAWMRGRGHDIDPAIDDVLRSLE